MKKIILSLFHFFTLSLLCSAQTVDFTQLVEPRIGTAHCRWFHFAPGSVPFGMAKPGPSTNGKLGNADGWQATGYDYRDTEIDGFPCVHEFQVGGISLMPCKGKASFKHENEVCRPGYYSVLMDNGIKAELTATKRVAFYRFIYPDSASMRLYFDINTRMGESGAVVSSDTQYNEDSTKVWGYVESLPEYVKVYQPGATVSIYFYSEVEKNAQLSQIDAKVGLSFTSVENARLNLEKETMGVAFTSAKYAAANEWNQVLSKIVVLPYQANPNAPRQLQAFYTGLYHALLGRGVCSDVNGSYPKHNGTIGQVPMVNGKPMFQMYNTDAMWGAQWNLNQLWTLVYPEHMSDFIQSTLQQYKDCGWLADGLACSRFVSGVGTNQLPLTICAAWECGIRDFDAKLAYEACIKNELDGKDRPLGAGKADTEDFLRLGYAPQLPTSNPNEEYYFGASHTLEYSYTAWAVAQMAKQVNDKQNYDKLMTLSRGWENIFDTKRNFVHPRLADGSYTPDFDPMRVWHGFQEGNAWQYTFYVPQDTKSLIKKVGKKTFVARLDSIFTLSEPKIFSGGETIDAFAGLRTLYNHGNQPCLHISWLFTDAGRPDLTEKWVHSILDKFYGTDGIHGYGYGQDEDEGQLGAWYVMSAMGLFSVDGLTSENPRFTAIPSIFDRVIIQLNPRYYKNEQYVIDGGKKQKNYIFFKDIVGK